MATTPHAPGIVDTNILVDAARNHPPAVAFLADLSSGTPGGTQLSVITAMELVMGCRNAAELKHVQSFLVKATTHALTPPISQLAHQWMETYFLSHGLTIPDSLIGATARELGLTLYTLNVRHFSFLPGLSVERPY